MALGDVRLAGPEPARGFEGPAPSLFEAGSDFRDHVSIDGPADELGDRDVQAKRLCTQDFQLFLRQLDLRSDHVIMISYQQS